MIYFEDLELGQVETFGPLTVTADAIIEFAREYDPQPFHLSDDGAKGTLFGSLAASGWHTAAMTQRLIIGYREEALASMGSPGLDDLYWRKPVYPGDELRARTSIVDKTPSKSRPEMGTVRIAIETLNQRDDVVMSFTLIVMVGRQSARKLDEFA